MNRDAQPANSMTELPKETRQFLASLSKDDVATLQAGMPIIRAVMGFGKVTKWLVISLLGLLAGVVLLGESVIKILAWLKPPPMP